MCVYCHPSNPINYFIPTMNLKIFTQYQFSMYILHASCTCTKVNYSRSMQKSTKHHVCWIRNKLLCTLYVHPLLNQKYQWIRHCVQTIYISMIDRSWDFEVCGEHTLSLYENLIKIFEMSLLLEWVMIYINYLLMTDPF